MISQPPPPLPPDSACEDTSSDLRKIFNSSTIQAAFAQLFADSKAANTEMGGFITLTNGEYVFNRLDGGVGTNNYPFPGLTSYTGTVVGFVHVHPDSGGINVTCRATPVSSEFLRHNDWRPSEQDWQNSTDLGKPVYVIDPQYVWPVDEGTPYNANATPNWDRPASAGSCAVVHQN